MADLKYNNYSKENAPKSLKKGEIVRFRVIGSEERLQSLLQLPYEDFIWDDGHGEMIPIGAIKRLRAEGKPEFYFIHLNEIQQKCWVLQGGKREDNEIYRFLQKCNFNKSNPDRDDAMPAIIEEYDSDSAVRREKEKRDLRRAAINAAANMSDAEVREYYGGDQRSAIDSLRIRIEDEAEKYPSRFAAKKEERKNFDIKQLVRDAEDKRIIIHDPELNQWIDQDSNMILQCGKGIGRGKYADFVKWVESGEGKDMMEVIIEKLS